MASPLTRLLGYTPQQLRETMLQDRTRAMRLRRGVIVTSMVGIAAMAATTLLQTGVVRRLPELPLRGFDTRKVNTSDEAFSYGGPDSPIAIIAHAVNLALAATGSSRRAAEHPWLPLLALGVEVPMAAVAAQYLFHQMPRVDRAWCPYCILDAVTHFATLGLLVPEAARAAGHLLNRSQRASAGQRE